MYTLLHSRGFSVVLSTWQIQILLFGTLRVFFLNIFTLQLVKSAGVKPADMEDQLRFNSHRDLMEIDFTILILQRGKLRLRDFIEPISHNRGAKRISVCGSFHCINLQQEVSEMSWLRTQPMKSEKSTFNLY